MRRKDIFQEKVTQIITLREKGDNWSSIEHKTGVKRRTAKRVYEQQYGKRRKEDLRKARANIATEEMRDHIYKLVTIAEYIVDNLEVPSWPHAKISATEFLRSLLRNPIMFQKAIESNTVQVVVIPYGATLASESKRAKRIARQNSILFHSLEDHIHQGNKWQAFVEWQKAWNSCPQIAGELSKHTKEMIRNFLNLEEQLKQELEKKDLVNEVVDKMADIVADLIWNGNDNTRLNEGLSSWLVLSNPEDDIEIWSLKLGNKQDFKLTYPKLKDKVTVICANTLYNLVKLRMAVPILGIKEQAGKAIEQLEEDWDELRLRPLLLDTWCELCPG